VIEYIISTKKIHDTKGFINNLIPFTHEYKEDLMQILNTAQQEGIQKGLQQGLAEGKHQEALEIARNMLLKKMDIELIKEITSLSDKDLTQLMQHH